MEVQENYFIYLLKTKYITAINKNEQVNAIATFYSVVCYNTYALIIAASIRVDTFVFLSL